jgi:hypothetical protein
MAHGATKSTVLGGRSLSADPNPPASKMTMALWGNPPPGSNPFTQARQGAIVNALERSIASIRYPLPLGEPSEAPKRLPGGLAWLFVSILPSSPTNFAAEFGFRARRLSGALRQSHCRFGNAGGAIRSIIGGVKIKCSLTLTLQRSSQA